jgi:N-acetylglucosaminyldiphosphoundecaprenol N-acetyl-beta-D-mannosaminyltransferase
MTAGAGAAAVPTIDILRLRLARITSPELVEVVAGAIRKHRGGWIVTANVDHLLRHCSNAEVAALNEQADLIVADGMPLVWAAWLQGTPLPGRVAGSDLVWTLAELAARQGFSLYLLGGAAGAAEGAAQRFRARWPELHLAGCSSPTLSEVPTAEQLASVREALAEAKPDIVYVALGSPKQERVIAALRQFLPATWWIGVGISLGFVAGRPQRAPRWVQRIGLEWFHRLLQEPRRLSRRYLLEDLPFTLRLLMRAWRMRRTTLR